MTFREGFLPFYHGQAYSPQVFGSEKIPAIAHLWTQSCFWSETSFIEQPSYVPHQCLSHPIGKPETGSRCSKDCQKSLCSYILPRTSGPPNTPYFQIGSIFLQNYQRWCRLFWIHIVQVWAVEQLVSRQIWHHPLRLSPCLPFITSHHLYLYPVSPTLKRTLFIYYETEVSSSMQLPSAPEAVFLGRVDIAPWLSLGKGPGNFPK